MDRGEFSKSLNLESVPLCAGCKEMLWDWAMTDPRTGGSKLLWTDFVRHFVECRMCTALQQDTEIAA